MALVNTQHAGLGSRATSPAEPSEGKTACPNKCLAESSRPMRQCPIRALSRIFQPLDAAKAGLRCGFPSISLHRWRPHWSERGCNSTKYTQVPALRHRRRLQAQPSSRDRVCRFLGSGKTHGALRASVRTFRDLQSPVNLGGERPHQALATAGPLAVRDIRTYSIVGHDYA
jgi:hypothetical protein